MDGDAKEKREERKTIVVIMGVSGCGKSTVSKALAAETGWPVLEGDDFHPPENINKMSAGTALTDDDRTAWLNDMNMAIDALPEATPVILACSALTPYVQARLATGRNRMCEWIWLDAPKALIKDRIDARAGHFMTSEMLESQFLALEAPANAKRFNVDQPLESTLSELVNYLDEIIPRASAVPRH